MREGYKDTPIGMIPEDWDCKSIGSISSVVRGASPRPKGDSRYYGGNIPRLMVEDVTRDGKYVIPQVDFLTEEGSKRSRFMKAGTLVMVCSGTVGIPAILKVDACVHDGFLAFPELSDSCSLDFLFYIFSSLKEKFNSSATHGGIFTNLTTTIIKEFQIPLPSLQEQIQIASILSTVDDKIDAINERIIQTQQIKNGLMQRLLTKGIGHTKFKDSPLGDIPEGWEVVKLGSIGDFSKGKGISKSELSATGIPCIRYGEIYTVHDYVIKKFYSFISHEIAKQSVRIKKNDILFAGSGETVEDIGKAVAFVGVEEVYAGGDTIIFRPTNANSVFLSYCLNSRIVIDQRSRFGQGHSVVHIYARDLSEILIPHPPNTEQNKIAEVFAEVDEKLDILLTKKAEYETLKKGLMMKLLTGEVRVKFNC